jgi:5-dehydro-2-deoxygluconokinase
MSFDLVTTGRISADLYPTEPGSLVDVVGFEKSLGGTATNVAVAAARLGLSAAIVTKVGADRMGEYCRAALERFGVSTAFVGVDPAHLTPIAFAELDPPEDPTLFFYREPTAPDLQLEPDDFPDDLLSGAGIFWVTGTSFSAEPSRTAVLDALRRRGRPETPRETILDLDYRPMFWSRRADATREIGAALEHATIALGNRTEVAVALGREHLGSPGEAARALLDRGVELAIVKLGGEGVYVSGRGVEAVVEPTPVTVVCGLGAGDAFGGAFCHALATGWDPVSAVRRANAAGAIVAGRLACADAMPTNDELESHVEAHAH